MRTQHEEVIVKGNDIQLKVAGRSANNKVAGAIIKYIEKEMEVSLVAMGAAAVNQMVKACIIARGILASKGIEMVIVPSFKNEEVNEVTKTAIRFYIRHYSMK